MDEILWSLSWSAALRPELPLIPDRRVFLCTPAGCSLTATVEGVPGLLLSYTDIKRLLVPNDHKENVFSIADNVLEQQSEDRTFSHAP